jgi:hypothetical protein
VNVRKHYPAPAEAGGKMLGIANSKWQTANSKWQIANDKPEEGRKGGVGAAEAGTKVKERI